MFHFVLFLLYLYIYIYMFLLLSWLGIFNLDEALSTVDIRGSVSSHKMSQSSMTPVLFLVVNIFQANIIRNKPLSTGPSSHIYIYSTIWMNLYIYTIWMNLYIYINVFYILIPGLIFSLLPVYNYPST